MFFSVVVPVYNVEKYLKECIDSILNQTFTDFELILVDDGSTDLSGNICDAYAAKDSRVKVIHKENGGQSTARNAGVDTASGQYVIFIDSDDMFSDNYFFEQVKEKTVENPDVIVYRYCKYYEDGKIDDCGIKLDEIYSTDKIEILKELVKRDAFFCSCWSKCTKLSLLKENNIFFDSKLSCEDMDWYYSVVQKTTSFKGLL